MKTNLLLPIIALAMLGAPFSSRAESVSRENLINAFVELEKASQMIASMHQQILESLPPDQETFQLTEFPEDQLPAYKKAFGHLQKSAELNPYNPEVYGLMGDYYAEALNEKTKALETYTKAIDLYPAYVPALAARANVQMDMAKLDDAFKDIEALQKINPEQSEILAERYKAIKAAQP